MKYAIMIVAALALAGCGGSKRFDRNSGQVTRFSSGPISTACLRADRKAANRQLCGCIQTVANRELSGADQRTAAKFFADPHESQEMRQSDNPRHESFWLRYREFAATAERSCKGY